LVITDYKVITILKEALMFCQEKKIFFFSKGKLTLFSSCALHSKGKIALLPPLAKLNLAGGRFPSDIRLPRIIHEPLIPEPDAFFSVGATGRSPEKGGSCVVHAAATVAAQGRFRHQSVRLRSGIFIRPRLENRDRGRDGALAWATGLTGLNTGCG